MPNERYEASNYNGFDKEELESAEAFADLCSQRGFRDTHVMVFEAFLAGVEYGHLVEHGKVMQ